MKLLHQHGIIHGDFTPDNIFYSEPNTIVIGDYGRSYYSTSNYASKYDIDNFNRIKNVITQLKNGMRFDNEQEFSKAINSKAAEDYF